VTATLRGAVAPSLKLTVRCAAGLKRSAADCNNIYTHVVIVFLRNRITII
jgi:hypothetical protein